MITSDLILPNRISETRIQFLISKRIDKDIAQTDLEMIKMKILNNDDGLEWTPEQTADAEIEYKRYLTLCRHWSLPAKLSPQLEVKNGKIQRKFKRIGNQAYAIA